MHYSVSRFSMEIHYNKKGGLINALLLGISTLESRKNLSVAVLKISTVTRSLGGLWSKNPKVRRF